MFSLYLTKHVNNYEHLLINSIFFLPLNLWKSGIEKIYVCIFSPFLLRGPNKKKKYSRRQGFCSLTHLNINLCEFFMRWGSVEQRGPNGTLCFTICWVILAVWVPMGSAELRRLSVALSHSPNGSTASWNWRAKTCSSSNCLCLKDGRGRRRWWGRGAFIVILLLSLILLLNSDLILCHTAANFYYKDSLWNAHDIFMIRY